jgi:hypothetical protein
MLALCVILSQEGKPIDFYKKSLAIHKEDIQFMTSSMLFFTHYTIDVNICVPSHLCCFFFHEALQFLDRQ